MKESVSKFMAYVHTSVNQKSKEYLANERRYNYTTPKSFLEQIKLYRSLLGQKSKDLTTKMERLENGLQKLNSTSAQVLSSSSLFFAQRLVQNVSYLVVFFNVLLFFLTVINFLHVTSRDPIFTSQNSHDLSRRRAELLGFTSEFRHDLGNITMPQGPFSSCSGWVYFKYFNLITNFKPSLFTSP